MNENKMTKVKEFFEKNSETICWCALGAAGVLIGSIVGNKVYSDGFKEGMTVGANCTIQWIDSTFKEAEIKKKISKYMIEHSVN